MEKGIEPIKPYKYHKPCVDVDYKSEIAKFNADQRHNSTFTIGNRTFNNSNSNNHGSQSARDNYSISNDQIVQIRNQLRMKNIGPTDASRLLRPSSKMEFQTQNQSNFDSSRHANLSKMQPIIPKENHALKYEGRIQGVSSTSANYARPSSSCYATEDFYVYC